MNQSQSQLFDQVVDAYTTEYLKSMKISTSDSCDLMIAYSDLTVWYFNKDSQHALSEIKKIWDEVPSTLLGTKSLRTFFTTLSSKLFSLHSNLVKKIQQSKKIKKLIQSTDEVSSAVSNIIPSLKDSEQEFFTYQTIISFPKDCELDSDSVQVSLNLHFAELSDLSSGFNEGFEGFSMQVLSKGQALETIPVDIHGNHAIWKTDLQFQVGSNEKIVQVKLREHVNSSVTELASFDIDILAYLMKEKREIEKIRVEESLLSFGGRERYELMDESKLKEPPKIAFAVTLFTSSLDSFYNWLHKRKQALDASAKSISKVIDGLGIKIAQLTRGFKTVSTDESRIFIVAENDEGCWCRSPKGNKKNKKSCIVL